MRLLERNPGTGTEDLIQIFIQSTRTFSLGPSPAQPFPLILWLILHEKTRCICRYSPILITLFWTETKLERFRYSSVNKGHLAQHCCHSMEKCPQFPSSLVRLCLYLWLCLQFCHQGLTRSQGVPWTLFYQLLASGQQLWGGVESGEAAGEGCHCTLPILWQWQSWFGELPPSHCCHLYASLPAQENYHTFPLC